MIRAALLFGVFITCAAVHPKIGIELSPWPSSDLRAVSFLSMANSTLQLETDPQMRGRVMALWAVAFMERHQLRTAHWLDHQRNQRSSGTGRPVRRRVSSRHDRMAHVRHYRTREAREASFIVDTAINDTIVVE